MSIQAFLKEFDIKLYKTKSYVTVQSDKYYHITCLNQLMKDEKVIKAEDTVVTEEFSQMTIEGFNT